MSLKVVLMLLLSAISSFLVQPTISADQGSILITKPNLSNLAKVSLLVIGPSYRHKRSFTTFSISRPKSNKSSQILESFLNHRIKEEINSSPAWKTIVSMSVYSL